MTVSVLNRPLDDRPIGHPVDFDTAIRAIYQFEWTETPQGPEHWCSVIQNLRKNKELAKNG